MNDPFDGHDPTLEPYASMSRDELLEQMEAAFAAEDFGRWWFLNEYLLDRLSTRELETHNRAMRLATAMIRGFDARGNAQCLYLCRLAGEISTRIVAEMPPLGPPQECN